MAPVVALGVFANLCQLLTVTATARAIDLPGHGKNPRRLENMTLGPYKDAILHEISEPTILLGHSMAGFLIAAATEAAPDFMGRLIFLSAYVSRDGINMIDLIRAQPEQPLRIEILTQQDRPGFGLSLTRQKELFYHDCIDDIADYAIRNSQVQALAPQTTRIFLGRAYEKVAKSYIRCDYNRIIPPQYQLDMVSDWPDSSLQYITLGHFAALADAPKLAALLDQITKDR